MTLLLLKSNIMKICDFWDWNWAAILFGNFLFITLLNEAKTYLSPANITQVLPTPTKGHSILLNGKT